MTRIAFTALDVANCGPWRGRHRFEFPSSGLAVFCAPNETGKTTLLRLVAAVLWEHQAPSRHWFSGENEPHTAALEYERFPLGSSPAPDQDTTGRFRIVRDFGARQVALFRWHDGQWHSVHITRHKKRGRTADSELWLEQIQRCFAPISPETFLRLTLLSPPFEPQPEGRLIQSLISGAGENTKEEALKILLERHRRITKYSREAGLSSSNARADGELDSLQAQKTALETALRSARQALEEGLKLRERIDALDTQIANLEAELKTVEERRQLLDEVRSLLRERRTKHELVEGLKSSCEKCEEITRQQQELKAQQESFPACLRQSTRQQRDEYRKILTDYQKLAQRFVEKSAELNDQKLAEQYRDVWNWPADASDRIQQIQRMDESVRLGETRLADARSRLERMSPVLDRRRQLPILLGAAVGVLIIGVAVGFVLGQPGLGILLGLIGAALVGGLVAWLYRPRCWPPEYEAAKQHVRELEEESHREKETLDRLWADIAAWAPSRQLPDLLQGLGRLKSLLQTRQEWELQKQELDRWALQLQPASLPAAIRELCGLEEPGTITGPLEAEVFQRGLERLQQFEDLLAREAACQRQLESLYQVSQVNSLEDLKNRRQNAELELQTVLLKLGQLTQDSPLAEAATTWDPLRLEEEVRRIEQQMSEIKQQLVSLREERNQRERELARWEGQNVVNVAQAEAELAQLEQRIALCQTQATAIARAHRLIEEAYRQFSQEHRQAIERGVDELMRDWTGNSQRRFIVDENFQVAFRIEPATAGDALISWEQLSQGTQDQLALAIRWAVLDRLAGEVILPLLLDDCFHMWDHQRRQNLLRFLQQYPDRQMILVTHDERFLSWGQPVVHTVFNP